jgi:hypothetical protein
MLKGLQVLTELQSAKEPKGKCTDFSGLLFDSKYRNLGDFERNILSDLKLSMLDGRLAAVLRIAT